MPTPRPKLTQMHSAVLRIRHELEQCRADKVCATPYQLISEFLLTISQFVWLLSPTVALTQQHLETIKFHLPQYSTKSFCGNDGVDHWRNQEIWDAALSGVKVAISTHQVLYDALLHGFVKMQSLALLVFDEGNSHNPQLAIFTLLTFSSTFMHQKPSFKAHHDRLLPFTDFQYNHPASTAHTWA